MDAFTPLAYALAIAVLALIPAVYLQLHHNHVGQMLNQGSDSSIQDLIGQLDSLEQQFSRCADGMTHVEARLWNLETDTPDTPLVPADMPGFDEPERLLTEMPRILNPIDPMDGVLPEIDRDWAANYVEQAEELAKQARTVQMEQVGQTEAGSDVRSE